MPADLNAELLDNCLNWKDECLQLRGNLTALRERVARLEEALTSIVVLTTPFSGVARAEVIHERARVALDAKP